MAIHTITTDANVGEDHRLVIQLPDEVPAGSHRVTIVVDTQNLEESKVGSTESETRPWRFPIMDGMKWIEGEQLTRDEFYDD